MDKKQFILKIVKMRKYLIRTGKSGKDAAFMNKLIKEIELFIDFNGKKMNDSQWQSFLIRKKNELILLMPNNNAKDSLIDQLQNLIS
jgi:hypothetical protein